MAHRVYLHIGEPKTGTTFLQQILWRNRAELAANGVVLPGHHPQDHFRATQDLRGIARQPGDPAASWAGEWDILAAQARQLRQPGATAVVSHELFAAADPTDAERAVRSLAPAEVHLVLTVRDISTLLPAEWQETVKHRNTRAWEDWLADVIDREADDPDRRRYWFWRVHDTLAILDVWSRFVPASRIHVITRPRRGSDPTTLWRRFASVIDVDPDCVDVTRARPNKSLGVPETEFLRRLNLELSDDVPGWFYMSQVKETLAHRSLSARVSSGNLVLPAERDPWAKEHADQVINGLRTRGCRVVGDLDDLWPPPRTDVGVRPVDVTTEQLLDVAVDSAAALVADHHRRAHPAVRPSATSAGTTTGIAERVEAAAASSTRIKAVVRALSSRYPMVRRLRVIVWRALERSRTRHRR